MESLPPSRRKKRQPLPPRNQKSSQERAAQAERGLARARARVAQRAREETERAAKRSQKSAKKKASRGEGRDPAELVAFCSARVKKEEELRKTAQFQREQARAGAEKSAVLVANLAPGTAKLRIKQRKQQLAEKKNREIDELILQQTSSIEAMNLARLISPRFEQKLVFKKQVRGKDEERLRRIMESVVT